MDSMSPQQGTMGQNRSESLTRDSKPLPDSNKKKMKTLAQRRQSAPSLVISKALTRSRSASRESSLTPVSPESCPLVQTFLAECLGRLFLGHVQTQLKTGLQTQERHLFLFTDTLLVAKAKSPTHFKVKAQVRVCEMWTANCMDEVCEGSTNPERSFVMGWPTCNCVATFSSGDLKEKWLGLINDRINEGKERDEPKTIPLKIFAKDIGNCAYAKTLSVNNSDSTDDVIRTALQQFGISGCVKDHRLWVSSCRDDPPYPLIGHEFPFSIKMSHIRDGRGSAGGVGRDPITPTDCPEVLLLDQCLPPDTQCQFILKPNRVVLGPPQLIEPGQQKTFKRKRSLINWPFWKGSNPQLDGLPLSPSLLSPSQGRLFGRPLSSVCSSDHGLPKPIMDMLGFLYLEGPYTRGIFRRSASAKACRELRDRLDSRAEDPEITHQPVFVIATVLKEFLRNVPGSILCVDLYEQWMDVMEGEEGEEKMSAVQRLLHLLPSENLLLLRHVIGVLHCIQGNAHDNQMNAFNLSVCIAPSMIWPPASSSPEVEGEATKKVCELVRFLIENCSTLLGDVTALFRDFSQKSSSDHGSDVSSFQMNDSSYDSLETELNDDPESPFQEQLPLRDKTKPDSRSRDSVITLSDGDPDPDPDSDLLLQLPPLFRPRRFSPEVRMPCASRQANGLSQGSRRLRRSSEPALSVANTPTSSAVMVNTEKCHSPLRKASYDAAMEGEGDEDEDEVFLEQGLNSLQLKEADKVKQREASGGQRKMKHTPPPPLRLDASCSSLSSPATSPTGSSLSSLDSAFSQYSTDYVTNGAVLQKSPRDSPPQKEALSLWQQSAQLPRTSHSSSHAHGLHPNMWLKKDRCLSLKQPDGGRAEELPAANRTSCPASDRNFVSVQEPVSANPNSQQRCSSPPSYQQALLQLQHHHSPFHRETEKLLTVKELRNVSDQTKHSNPTFPKNPKPHTGSQVTQKLPGKDCVQPPQSVFYGQSATTLVLQRPKSHSLTPTVEGLKERKTLPRRASEPSKSARDSNPSISLTLDRSSKGHPRNHRPRAPEVDSKNSKQHLCLSPSASRVVKDYFSMQGQADPDACLRRSREVALAIVQSKKDWQNRRCSDPRLEDFEKLFFAEESYV